MTDFFRKVLIPVVVFLASSGLASADRGRLFTMPLELPLNSELFNPLASKVPEPVGEGRFAAVIWEPNPFRPDGKLVPSDWPAGEKTGLIGTPRYQYSYSNSPESTTVQYLDGAFGAYLNSRELEPNKPYHKLMIAPFYRWGIRSGIEPFSSGARGVHASFKMQVPYATDSRRRGSAAYILVDFEFIDKHTGTKISYGCSVFFNGAAGWPGEINFDGPSSSWMINTPIKRSATAFQLDPDSNEFVGEPWRGWRTFGFVIDRNSFESQLKRLQSSRPIARVSSDPADYVLSQVHVNAELNFSTGPATLGWSIRDLTVDIEK